MKFSKVVVPLLFGISMSGCKTKAGENFQPAVLEDAGKNREQVLLGVKQLFNGLDVLLAKDAFTKNSKIMIERRPIKTMEGNFASGAVQDVPQAVELVTDGQYCYLNKVGTELSVRLDGVSCKPVQ